MNKRIYLRAFEPEDYLTIVKWRNDREIAAKLGGVFLLCCSRKEMGGRYHLPQ